jgi:hypothetical protein
MTIDIGKITINDPTLLNNIKHSSIEEIRHLFVAFLAREVPQTQESNRPSKWGEFARKMQGSFTPQMVEHLKQGHTQAREQFQARDLTSQ